MHPKDIIKLAIRTRLELVAPYVKSGTWPEAMSSFIFGKHPLSVFSQAFYHLTSSVSSGGSSTNMSKNSITGLNAMYHLAILADEICFLTGVRDTDVCVTALQHFCGDMFISLFVLVFSQKTNS